MVQKGEAHRVGLGWLFEEIMLNAAISVRYVNTKEQAAANLTTGSFFEVE